MYAESVVSDVADANDITAAATKIMSGCIKNGPPNTGGLIRNIGTLESWRSQPAIS